MAAEGIPVAGLKFVEDDDGGIPLSEVTFADDARGTSASELAARELRKPASDPDAVLPGHTGETVGGFLGRTWQSLKTGGFLGTPEQRNAAKGEPPQTLAEHQQAIAAQAAKDPQLRGLLETDARVTKRAKASMGAATGGAVLGPLVGGFLAPLARGPVSRIGAASVGGGVTGAASSVVGDASAGQLDRETPKRAGEAGFLGAAMGAGGQILVEGGKKVAGPIVAALDARRTKRITKDLAKGADPTHARRMAGKEGEVADEVVAFADRHPKVLAARKNPEKLTEETGRIISDAAKQTGPIYEKLDQTVGKVPVKDILAHLDGAIKAETRPGGSANLRSALRELRDDVVEESGELKSWTHKQLREWVTQRLKVKTQSMGSLNETEAYEVKNALHDVADSYLKGRLANVRTLAGDFSPELGAEVDRLRALNTDIAMGIRIQQAADNAVARSYWVNRAGGGDKLAAGVMGAVLGTGGGLGGAAAGFAVAKGAPGIIRGGAAIGEAALRELARAAQSGSDVGPAVANALAAGIPQAAIDAIVSRREGGAAR